MGVDATSIPISHHVFCYSFPLFISIRISVLACLLVLINCFVISYCLEQYLPIGSLIHRVRLIMDVCFIYVLVLSFLSHVLACFVWESSLGSRYPFSHEVCLSTDVTTLTYLIPTDGRVASTIDQSISIAGARTESYL